MRKHRGPTDLPTIPKLTKEDFAHGLLTEGEAAVGYGDGLRRRMSTLQRYVIVPVPRDAQVEGVRVVVAGVATEYPVRPR